MAKRKTKPPPAIKKRPRVPRSADLSYIAEDLRGLAFPIADLVDDPENPRTHSDGNLTAIVASLRKYGQRKPIVVNIRNLEVEAGNGTVAASRHLGWSYLAAVLVDDDAMAARGFSIADNRSAELAEWNLDVLLPQLDVLEADDSDLFAEMLLADLQPVAEDEPEKVAVSSGKQAFQVVVECESEEEQRKVFQQMKKRGLRARMTHRAEFVTRK